MRNKTLLVKCGEILINGEKIFEVHKTEKRVNANCDDVKLGIEAESRLICRR